MKALFPTWSQPPETLTIGKGDLHVWRANLDLSSGDLETLKPLLSPQEMERADRFFFSKDRDHFIVSHACVRSVLSRYLRVAPEQISFVQNSFGKPAVANGFGDFKIEFNLTHSRDYALVAVTMGLQVGVDVEFIRPDFGGLNIARRFFSTAEYQALFSLPVELQSEAFFRCWTRKEAYIKAKGKGLLFPLDQFDVSVHPREPAALISTRAAPEEAARWSLIQADPAPGYCGAVAVESASLANKYLDWSPQNQMSQFKEFNPIGPVP